jgi:hypothetical protein
VSNVKDLALAENAVIDKGMIQRCVLLDKELNGFLRSDTAKEGTHCVKLGVAVSQEFLYNAVVYLYLILAPITIDLLDYVVNFNPQSREVALYIGLCQPRIPPTVLISETLDGTDSNEKWSKRFFIVELRSQILKVRVSQLLYRAL